MSRTFITFGYVDKVVKLVGSKFICGPMSIGGSNPPISATSIYRHIWVNRQYIRCRGDGVETEIWVGMLRN